MTHDPSNQGNPAPRAARQDKDSKSWLIYALAFAAMIGVLYWAVPENRRVAADRGGEANTGAASTTAPADQAPTPAGRRAQPRP